MVSDVFCPAGNEVELAAYAKTIGFKEIIFLYASISQKTSNFSVPGLKIHKAALVKNINEVGIAKRDFDFVFAPAERMFFESKKVDFITGAERDEARDFLYQRRAGLDDASCKLARENGITIVFNSSFASDKILLGRMSQNALLCRRLGVKALVATFAKNLFEMRSAKDLEGFSRTIKLK